MNHAQRLLIAIGIAAAGASAYAVEAEQWNPPAGHTTRAEVRAQLRAAEASGEMNDRNEAYGTVDEIPQGTLTRSQVLAELRDAEASGEMNDRNEAYGGFESLPADTADRAMVQTQGTRAMHAQAHEFESPHGGS